MKIFRQKHNKYINFFFINLFTYLALQKPILLESEIAPFFRQDKKFSNEMAI